MAFPFASLFNMTFSFFIFMIFLRRLPGRLAFFLRDVVPQSALTTGHVFLGFTGTRHVLNRNVVAKSALTAGHVFLEFKLAGTRYVYRNVVPQSAITAALGSRYAPCFKPQGWTPVNLSHSLFSTYYCCNTLESIYT